MSELESSKKSIQADKNSAYKSKPYTIHPFLPFHLVLYRHITAGMGAFMFEELIKTTPSRYNLFSSKIFWRRFFKIKVFVLVLYVGKNIVRNSRL